MIISWVEIIKIKQDFVNRTTAYIYEAQYSSI